MFDGNYGVNQVRLCIHAMTRNLRFARADSAAGSVTMLQISWSHWTPAITGAGFLRLRMVLLAL